MKVRDRKRAISRHPYRLTLVKTKYRYVELKPRIFINGPPLREEVPRFAT